MRLLLVLLLALLAACSDDPGSDVSRDAGEPDPGGFIDEIPDAGADAGSVADAGAAADAGLTPDAGAADAG
ncbi:MAG: hypothetical protein ACK4N5_26490, partial [Myxococcales bacterium]